MSTTILAAIFVFGLLVLVHELGHFITAKMVGMRVDEFALGFGPKLISRKYGETTYSLRIIPLGGFNKIAGMDPDEEQDERSFCAKPVWARMLVIVAGSAMNLLLPVLLFTIVFVSAGMDKVSDQPIIGRVFPDKPAAVAGFVAGDRIVTINNEPVISWRQFVASVQTNSGNNIMVTIERNGEIKALTVKPEYDEKAKRGIIGVIPNIENIRPSLPESVVLAVKQNIAVTSSMIAGLADMVTGKAAADVAGPIGVAQMAGQVAQQGFIPLLQFAAFLSINLGIINLLPVPVLDGGHIITLLIEAIRRKPLNRNVLQFVQMIGFALLMLLLIMATFMDVTRGKPL